MNRPSKWQYCLTRFDSWGGWWPERFACLLALAGVLYAVMSGFQVRSWQGSASDVKTVYAAAWNYGRGLSAYSFPDLARVFQAQGVVQPENWYAHAPVYPPFTLVLVAPMTLLPMVPGIYVWIALCGLLMACAAAALLRWADQAAGLGRLGRMTVLALLAASPLLSFGLEMGNVSVAVAALCLLGVTWEPPARFGPWRIVSLVLALLLKPHLAFWFVLALLLLREPLGRRLALWSAAWAALLAGLQLAVAAVFSPAGTQLGAYRAVLAAEMGAGSMSPGNRELIGVAAQITSLSSLLGYLVHHPPLAAALSWVILAMLGAALLWATRILPATGITRMLLIGSWCAFGLIATYHRAADGTVLFVLLPWLLLRFRARVWDPVAWLALTLAVVMSCEKTWEFWEALALRPGWWHWARLILYRQSSLGAVGLAVLMVGVCAWQAVSHRRLLAQS